MNTNVYQSEEIQSLINKINKAIFESSEVGDTPLLFEPINYINNLQGKRLRPLLVLLSGLSLGGKIESLLFPAVAIELLHNFTLVHDDIMDNDDVRRGKPTLHVKWDLGTAILAGDGLLGLAYRKILLTPDVNQSYIASLFTNALIDICEGQALDKSFETRQNVSEEQYLEMINKKTAVLIQLSCQLGAITAGADEDIQKKFSDFGYNIGMGFQIQDDLLDIIADESKLGKKVGSDLAMNKKTILTTKLLQSGLSTENINDVNEFKKYLENSGIINEVSGMVDKYFTTAYEIFDTLQDNNHKTLLLQLTDYIKSREK
jgi:geranylgeranyl diphosphate synthase, type II